MANATEQKGTTNAIRKVLKAAGVNLSVADILDALPARIETNAKSVSALCRQRAIAGEFTSGVEGSRCVYGINAEWDGVSRISQAALAPVMRDVVPPAPAVPAAMPPPVAIPRHRRALGLVDRLEAILTDLKDAIGDACDEELPHPVIKALVAADGATQLALRKLAA